MSEYQKSAVRATARVNQDSDNETDTAPKVPDQFADESFKLFSKIQVLDPTPEEAKRIRNKCLWRILPFLCIGYHLMYVDKQTVRPKSNELDDAVLKLNSSGAPQFSVS